MIHPTETNGLNLSPILESFQQNPVIPFRFTKGFPGSWTYKQKGKGYFQSNVYRQGIRKSMSLTNPPSNIVGLISRRQAVVQMRSRRTVIRLAKLKIALIFYSIKVCANNPDSRKRNYNLRAIFMSTFIQNNNNKIATSSKGSILVFGTFARIVQQVLTSRLHFHSSSPFHLFHSFRILVQRHIKNMDD